MRFRNISKCIFVVIYLMRFRKTAPFLRIYSRVIHVLPFASITLSPFPGGLGGRAPVDGGGSRG